MNTTWKPLIKKDLIGICILFVMFYAFWQIHYIHQSPWPIIKLVLSHFYLFIIPGYFLTLVYSDKIQRVYRIFIGIGLGYSSVSLLIYLLNLIFKINMLMSSKIIPIFLSITGILLFYFKIKKNTTEI